MASIASGFARRSFEKRKRNSKLGKCRQGFSSDLVIQEEIRLALQYYLVSVISSHQQHLVPPPAHDHVKEIKDVSAENAQVRRCWIAKRGERAVDLDRSTVVTGQFKSRDDDYMIAGAADPLQGSPSRRRLVGDVESR